MLAEPAVLAQRFVGRNPNLALGLVLQARLFQPDFAIGRQNLSRLGSTVPDVAAGLARRARTGDLFRAQPQDHLQNLVPDLMDHGFYHLAGALDQVDDGKQDLPVGLAELLDNGG